jgi:hypothetical protein
MNVSAYNVFTGKPERDVLADSGVQMRTILKYTLDKVHEYGLESFFICLSRRSSVGPLHRRQ